MDHQNLGRFYQLKIMENNKQKEPLHIKIPNWIAYIVIAYLFCSILYFLGVYK